MKLFEAVNKACGDLPEGYHINLHMENGAGYVELFDFEGDEIPLALEDLNLTEQVNEAVFAAKSADNHANTGGPDTAASICDGCDDPLCESYCFD